MTQRLRIAMLCHSTNPRGGVAHAMALGEALLDIGHDVTIIAPDVAGRGFPRATRCRTINFPARKIVGELKTLVIQRSEEYGRVLSNAAGRFDLLHAHDALSGSAVAAALEAGLSVPYVRTVHHVDQFSDPFLATRQISSIASAAAIACVSNATASEVHQQFSRASTVVGNGVDTCRFSAVAGPADAAWRAGLGDRGPRFLAVGGVEQRKNTVRLLQAFALILQEMPSARLTIVGGASLLDHSTCRRQFDAVLAAHGPSLMAAVNLIGVVDDVQMPALYRAADALVFPSIHEGFGLAVLEAMACGTPVVLSRIAPFDEYVADLDAAYCDPYDPVSIAQAMRRAIDPTSADYRARGLLLSKRHTWAAVATAQARIYADATNGALTCQK